MVWARTKLANTTKQNTVLNWAILLKLSGWREIAAKWKFCMSMPSAASAKIMISGR